MSASQRSGFLYHRKECLPLQDFEPKLKSLVIIAAFLLLEKLKGNEYTKKNDKIGLKQVVKG